MQPLFETNRRLQNKTPSRIGKMARIWNADIRRGNLCLVCRVDIGGKDEAQELGQMANHMRKVHAAEYEAQIRAQNKQATNRDQE